jgi:lysophospholipid acyltransferase 7
LLVFGFLEPFIILYRTKEKEAVQPYNFETIHNIDEYAAEFYDVRGSLKSWNMTVQFWLATNVHRRFPLKALRTTVTMLTSAFWHGVYSGYYLSMLTVPFILIAEDAAKRKFRTLVRYSCSY